MKGKAPVPIDTDTGAPSRYMYKADSNMKVSCDQQSVAINFERSSRLGLLMHIPKCQPSPNAFSDTDYRHALQYNHRSGSQDTRARDYYAFYQMIISDRHYFDIIKYYRRCQSHAPGIFSGDEEARPTNWNPSRLKLLHRQSLLELCARRYK